MFSTNFVDSLTFPNGEWKAWQQLVTPLQSAWHSPDSVDTALMKTWWFSIWIATHMTHVQGCDCSTLVFLREIEFAFGVSDDSEVCLQVNLYKADLISLRNCLLRHVYMTKLTAAFWITKKSLTLTIIRNHKGGSALFSVNFVMWIAVTNTCGM